MKAPNRNNLLRRLGKYIALIAAPYCKTFINGSRSQRALIGAPDRNNILGRLGKYLALIRAPRCKTFIDGSGSQ